MAIPPTAPVDTEIPIWAPAYGISFRFAVSRFWKKYATFSGRASRSEYWWAMLFVGITAGIVDVFTFVVLMLQFVDPRSADTNPYFFASGAILVVWAAVLFLPIYAITARRLHDTNRSGWWVLLSLVPYAGIVVLVFTVQASDPLGQRFDLPPLARLKS